MWKLHSLLDEAGFKTAVCLFANKCSGCPDNPERAVERTRAKYAHTVPLFVVRFYLFYKCS